MNGLKFDHSTFIMSFSQYIKSAEFGKTALKIVLFYGALIGLSWLLLNWYTDHGKFISVPNLKGQKLEAATEALNDRGLEVLVIDSIYDRKADPGTVFEQSPAPESQVKEGRQVYLTIYRFSPPMETVGVREGDYVAVAMIKLRNKGIECDTTFEDNNTMAGSVIRVLHKGRKVQPDHLVARGERLTLVIGRVTKGKVIVPDLTGLTCAEAEALLAENNLECNCRFEPNIALPSSQDSLTYKSCKQDPLHDPLIGTTPGRIVDVWLYNTPCEPKP